MSLSAVSMAAQAADGTDIVAIFADACLGERPAYDTIDALGQARGWSRYVEPGSAKRNTTPSPFGRSKSWVVNPTIAANGEPEISAIVAQTSGTSKSDSSTFIEACIVSRYDYRSADTVASLQEALGADVTAYRSGAGRSMTTQWVLNKDRMDGVVLLEQDLRNGPATQITRGRMLLREQP